MTHMIYETPGTRYGHWEVLSFHEVDSHGDARWWCRCSICGGIYSVAGFRLRNGKSTKCWPCHLREPKR